MTVSSIEKEFGISGAEALRQGIIVPHFTYNRINGTRYNKGYKIKGESTIYPTLAEAVRVYSENKRKQNENS